MYLLIDLCQATPNLCKYSSISLIAWDTLWCARTKDSSIMPRTCLSEQFGCKDEHVDSVISREALSIDRT